MLLTIKHNYKNKYIDNILNDNFITITILDDRKIMEYNYHKIILVSFVYKSRLQSQAFYETKEGTWLPFDGIKAQLEENIYFSNIFDTNNFEKFYGFGTEELMLVSYLIGGGMWLKNNKFSTGYELKPRICQLTNLESHKVKFEHPMLVNHFVNYSISYNYINLKKDEPRKSAFDGAHKAENWSQMEYVPVKKSLCKELDDALYNNKINIPIEVSNYTCTIL